MALKTFASFAAISFLAGTVALAEPSTLLYIGTYTKPGASKGIYLSRLDPATGAMTEPELAGEFPNPSFVTISPNHKFLLAANETHGKSTIGSFAIKPDGTLQFINEQPTSNLGCYVTLDDSGKNVLVSTYLGGDLEQFPLSADGTLSAVKYVDLHKPGKPHAHCVDFDAANHFALCCDLGLDKVFVYRFDAASGTLAPNDPPFTSVAPKSGPRHLAFSPSGKFVYVINELASTMTALTYDTEHGVLHEIQTLSTLPADFTGHNSTAEVIMHPSGKFLYGSNRGHNSIVMFNVDPQSGRLTLGGHTPSGGKIPRGFGIDPSGAWLIVGHQDSDTLVEFRIDPSTGGLTSTGVKFNVGAPVCVKFMVK